ncbi:ABC transporter permease [Oleiharenicola lentus]|uniref:ABC transporter permease n=1 Tax=Oleiharenicola lentus TaxID=2508720 RepID=A0A4Q1CAG2_9BACT|nr:ABC transporter permease [Oleiharenicola lentus]RXK56024.1 ABC transporter permease [Oleiharenicola lentus]
MRLAFRQLGKNPSFTLTVTLVLALGIGATTAIFSVIHAVLINPFPYHEGNKLLFVGSNRTDQPGSQMPVTYPDYLDWRASAKTVEHLAFAAGNSATLTGIAEPVSLRNAAISANTWPLLGIAPELGRVFTEAEDHVGAEAVVVLSHATWQTHFNGDPAILNRPITLDGRLYTVVGVMPPRFKFWAGDCWTPVDLQADTDQMRSRIMRMDSWVVTRAKPGLTPEEVRTELNHLAAQIALAHPDTNKGVGVEVRHLSASVSGPLRGPLMLLLSAVAMVLLIACANVANLFLARTSARQREFAVRAALGASRGQLIRQTLVESLPLALLGGAAGLGLAAFGLDALLALLPRDAVPAESVIRINGPVLLFSLVVTLGTLLLFTLFPALEGSRAALSHSLQEGARGTAGVRTGRVRAGLIIAEVCLSLMLLATAGLLLRSFARIHAVDLGFNRENLLLIPVQLSESRYGGSEQATTFFENAVERIGTLPGVTAVAASTGAPFANVNGMPLVVEGRTYTDVNQLDGVIFSLVTRDYFRAQGLTLRRGRIFDDNDRAGTQPVIVLNEAAVKKFLSEGDPLGQRVMLGAPDHLITPGMLPPGMDKFQWATVVGVVQDVRYFGQQNDAPPAAYLPVRQGFDYAQLRRFMLLVVRTSDRPTDVIPALRSVVKSLDSDLPLGRIATADLLAGELLQGTRFNTILLGLFAGVALVLAAVGIYGVVSWNVTQRTKEIGIRQALGADRAGVLRLVIGQSMRIVGAGILLGLVGSFALAHFLRSQLFQIQAFDPVTFLGVVGLLSAAALLACWLPARRAAKVDPVVALRSE